MHHIEEEVIKNFKQWQELENETLSLSKDLEKKSDNLKDLKISAGKCEVEP